MGLLKSSSGGRRLLCAAQQAFQHLLKREDSLAIHDPLRAFGREAGLTTFGMSAGFIAASMKAGVKPSPWDGLRSIGSTGSPLPVEGFEWIYDRFPDVWLFSTSGGTDLCTAFVGGCPMLPVYSGELQARCLGAAVEA